MTNQIVMLDGFGKVTITSKNYIAQGGEGSCYHNAGKLIKLYHAGKPVIPEQKIKELSRITPTNVLGPKGAVRDSKSRVIGFYSVFMDGTSPLCKLFTKDFRDRNGFTESDAVEVVKKKQLTLEQIHREGFLVVDFNEMNFLIDKTMSIPFFIDVDSWQTPSFRATALMESVRDRLIKNNQFTEGSDWFSFAVVSFQLYVGVHPYKGIHPDYKPKDWLQRMEDGVSVFDPKSKIPSSCRPFSVIPKAHLKWFEEVFVHNGRSAPPLPDGIAPIAVQVVLVHGSNNFSVSKIIEYADPIINVFYCRGEMFAVSGKNLYMGSRRQASVYSFAKSDKTAICESPGEHPIFCQMAKGILNLSEIISDKKIDEIKVDDFMVRDGRLYTVCGDSVFENVFVQGQGGKILHSSRRLCSYLENSSKVFDGVIYQDSLGQPTFVVPYEKGASFIGIIKEIHGYRVLDAKAEDNVLVVLGEQKGIYTRFIVIFEQGFKSYNVRMVDDVSLESINFTKLPGGNRPCVLYAGDGKVEIFVNNSKIKEVDNAPFDSSMKLFNDGGKVFFVNGKEINSVSTK